MSFVFGGTNTDSLAGVTATLSEWPSLGGLSLESDAVEGRDARYFYGASQSHSSFTFDVIIEGSSPAEVFARRDSFVGLLAPSRGAQPLIVEIESAWKWSKVSVSEQINWSRYTWDYGVGFRLRADVSFETVGDAFAVSATDDYTPFSSTLSFTLDKGNTESFPMIEFPSGSAAVVTIGGFTVNVAATTSGRVNVLDYNNFEFYQRSTAGTRLGSLVRFMSHYRRASLQVGQAVTVSAVGAPAGTRRLYPNARRV